MITGKTKVFFMVADPIAHVRTPEVINPLFAAKGIDAVMVPLHLTPTTFGPGIEMIRAIPNVGGLVVSVPLKEAALALADEVLPPAARIGVANVLRLEAGRLIATNLDGLGFLTGVLQGDEARGRHVLLLGAGGAGRAIAITLADAGVASLRICDLDQERARALAEEVQALCPAPVTSGGNEVGSADLIINATPLGLYPEDPLPMTGDLHPGLIVADIVMKPRETRLILAAQAAGAQVRYGAGMLDSQLELMIQHFGL